MQLMPLRFPACSAIRASCSNASGNPVPDTTYSVVFRLYTVASGGSSFWNETQTVRTKAGLFSVLLGSVTPIDSLPQAGTCYLGMKVGCRPGDDAEIADCLGRLCLPGAQGRYRQLRVLGGATASRPGSGSGGDSVLYTVRQLGIARGGSGDSLYGNVAQTQVNLGVQLFNRDFGSELRLLRGGRRRLEQRRRCVRDCRRRRRRHRQRQLRDRERRRWQHRQRRLGVRGRRRHERRRRRVRDRGRRHENTASHVYATVGGGEQNTARAGALWWAAAQTTPPAATTRPWAAATLTLHRRLRLCSGHPFGRACQLHELGGVQWPDRDGFQSAPLRGVVQDRRLVHD